jgi:uridine phosphorylase
VTDHLRPTAAIASRALLPGDPGRALALAQDLLDGPLMANHARGLWGYTARTANGTELTIQSTGIGGPSVAIVLEELAALGVERAVRLGTCKGLDATLEPGDTVVAEAAISPGGDAVAEPDHGLTKALLTRGSAVGVTVAATDRYYDPDRERADAVALAAGARAVDLGTAAAFEVGARLGVGVAAALVVSRSASGETLDDEAVGAASVGLGRVAASALGAA